MITSLMISFSPSDCLSAPPALDFSLSLLVALWIDHFNAQNLRSLTLLKSIFDGRKYNFFPSGICC